MTFFSVSFFASSNVCQSVNLPTLVHRAASAAHRGRFQGGALLEARIVEAGYHQNYRMQWVMLLPGLLCRCLGLANVPP